MCVQYDCIQSSTVYRQQDCIARLASGNFLPDAGVLVPSDHGRLYNSYYTDVHGQTLRFTIYTVKSSKTLPSPRTTVATRTLRGT